MESYRNEKNLFNRTLSSFLKWKKRNTVLFKKSQKKANFLISNYRIHKKKNHLKFKKKNSYEITRKIKGAVTITQVFNTINKIRKKILNFNWYRCPNDIPTNYFFWHLYFNLKILFFSIKVL